MALLLILAGCHQAWRIMEPARIDGVDAVHLESETVLQVYYATDLTPADLEPDLTTGRQALAELLESVFDQVDYDPPTVVIYRTNASYQNHIPGGKAARAHFDRKTRRIHIVRGASRQTWRHELVHALLEQRRFADRRVQEGLAWFLQDQDFRGSIRCSPATMAIARPGPRIQGAWPPLDQFFGYWPLDFLGGATRDIATAWFEFLWSRKAFKKSLDYYLKYPQASLEYELTRGDRLRLEKLYRDFQLWLQGTNQQHRIGGC
ncbi:MAG: hypothetical protein KDK39_06495 [Leptospiraceae bacterium]|nr:hypothetical protein [Leptospiraceae bacterium]